MGSGPVPGGSDPPPPGRDGRGRSGRRLPGWGVALSVAVVLLITLVPRGQDVAPVIRLCLICGTGGLASLLLNVVLFLPLGAALRVRFGWIGRALAAGFLLSLGVELTQLLIPGRFTTLADLLANSAGAGLGAILAVRPRAWIRPEPRAARLLAIGWAAAAAAGLALPGALLAPTFPPGELYAQWTPRLRALESYEGRLLSARIGAIALESGLVGQGDAVRDHLRDGAPLHVRFEAGPRPPGLAPVLRLVAGPYGVGEEALQVGVDRDDLVIRPRYVADDVHLSRPDLRIRGVMRTVGRGETVEVRVREDRARGGHEVTFGEGAPVFLGVTAGRGWSLLRYPRGLPERAYSMMDLLWIAALLIPLGWWAPSGRMLILAGAAPLAALALVPLWSVLLAPPLTHFLAAAAGLLAWRGLALVLGRASHRLRHWPE